MTAPPDEKTKLPLIATYYDLAPILDQPAEVKKLLPGAAALLIGTSVWAQGPTSISRTFFEAINTDSIAGVAASTWVTSGGAHTGAATAHDSNLSTLRGMGAATFTFGQKQVIFTTDESLDGSKPGEFTLLDLWFMDGLAKAAIVNATHLGNPQAAGELWKKLDLSPIYYRGFFPKSFEALAPRFEEIRKQINAPAKTLDGLTSKLP